MQENLVRQGLARKGTFNGPEIDPRDLLTLTKRGHRLLRPNRLVSKNQAVYYGFVKPLHKEVFATSMCRNKRWTANSRFVFAAIGLHPELAGQRRAELALLEQLMADTRFVGEIGLDGSAQHRSTFTAQREVFSRALQSAETLGGRVLSIHSRRAAREVVASLAKHTTPHRTLPILHWFSDSVPIATEAARLGCYFSINRRMIITESGMALIKSLPADRLLTETDAPFIEIENRKSEPRDVESTILQLAQLRNSPVGEMKRTITANAGRVLAFAGISIPASPD